MKERLSVSVDADLIKAAEQAVVQGHFESLSAWVNEALRSKIEQDRRLQALTAFVSAYESEHGEISEREMLLAARRARGSAIPVRGSRVEKKASARHRRRTG